MILVIGEILIDMVGNIASNSLQLEGKLGGAPFNVASNLADLDVNTTFYGVVGKDVIGDFLLDQLQEHKECLNLFVKQKEDRMTTIAFFLKDKGNFQFLRKIGADYCFNKEELISFPNKETKYVHFGSLFLSNKEARETIFDVIKEYKKQGKIISFDVNFRSDIFEKNEDYISYYLNMIEYVDILKVTKDELEMLTNIKDLLDALKKFNNKKIVFVTDGENGSYCYYKNKLYFKKASKVIPVDTIGCGDSFMAGVLSYLYNLNLDNILEEDIEKILSRGNECGRRTCLVKGAIHGYKSLKDLED